jgi:hypothetical protein
MLKIKLALLMIIASVMDMAERFKTKEESS